MAFVAKRGENCPTEREKHKQGGTEVRKEARIEGRRHKCTSGGWESKKDACMDGAEARSYGGEGAGQEQRHGSGEGGKEVLKEAYTVGKDL